MPKMLLHLALLLVAPSNVSAFRSMAHVSSRGSPFMAVSTQHRVPLTPLFFMFAGRDDHAVGKFNIKHVTDEAEEALKAAAKALHVSPAAAATAKATAHSKSPTNLAPPTRRKEEKAARNKPFLFFAKSVGVSPTPPARPPTVSLPAPTGETLASAFGGAAFGATPPTVSLPAPTGEALASAFGGAALGAVAASAIAAQIPELSDSVLAAIPPLVSAAALGGAAYSGASEESRVGELTRKILGKTVIGIGRGLVAAVKSVAGRIVAEISSIPGKIVSAVQKQVKRTTDKIKAIPSNFRAAAQRKAEKTAVDTKKAAKKAAEALAIEIKATPGRVAESTKQAVNKSVDNTKQHVTATVKEVQAYPSKKYTEIENSIAAFLGNGESKTQAPPKSTKVADISLPIDLPKYDRPDFHILPIVSYEF
jgi:hypothetical protein